MMVHEYNGNSNRMLLLVMSLSALIAAVINLVTRKVNNHRWTNVRQPVSGFLEAQQRLVRLEQVVVWEAPMEKSHRFGL